MQQPPNMAPQPIVKLCVVMDLTDSMKVWLQATKDEAVRVVRQIQEEHSSKTLEVAFVGYRDFCDGPHRLTSQPFARDLDTFEKTLRSQRAFGGGDMAEDFAGGLAKAVYDLDWSNSAAQILILITDAPPHGLQWHFDDVTDDYPEGELDSVPLQVSLRRFMDASNSNPSITFLHLTEHTHPVEHWMQALVMCERGLNRFYRVDVSDIHFEGNLAGARDAVGHSLHLAVTQSLSMHDADDSEDPTGGPISLCG